MTHPGLWAQEKEWTQEAAPGIEIQPTSPPQTEDCSWKLPNFHFTVIWFPSLRSFLILLEYPQWNTDSAETVLMQAGKQDQSEVH